MSTRWLLRGPKQTSESGGRGAEAGAASARQVVLLAAFALAVIGALACDARCYHGVDPWGRPLYQEDPGASWEGSCSDEAEDWRPSSCGT